VLKVKRRQAQCLLLHFTGTQAVGGNENAQNITGTYVALKIAPANVLWKI
jgi:hypothetical protein